MKGESCSGQPTGKFARRSYEAQYPAISVKAVLSSDAFSSVFVIGWKCGMILSTRNIIENPSIKAKNTQCRAIASIDSGIRLMKEIAIITPAAKPKHPDRNPLPGLIRIPRKDPISGPRITTSNIQYIVSMQTAQVWKGVQSDFNHCGAD